MNCRNCGKPYTKKELERKRLSKIENAKASAAKARLNGNKPGPARKVDRKEILKLRAKGMSYRKIAAAVGCSAGLVLTVVRSETFSLM